MITSPIVEVQKLTQIGENIKAFLDTQKGIMSANTISSPRAVGDAMQSLLEANFDTLLKGDIKDYSKDFARRAMADIAFTDIEDFYHVVDIKTHRLDTVFNMPNLTSVERLTRFYETDKNYFDLLLITYSVTDDDIKIEKVQFTPIENLKWNCLTIGALGWGQIQIANSNKVNTDHSLTRKDWMIQLCDTMLQFYPNEISKIGARIDRFKEIKEHWTQKS
ncbi:MAG TPA: hypothetical protein VHC21_01385 [Candidatus Saccharimonadales bacterium]|nr:hypothetical protein [Candidatus Saccharimonadales bacterium]